MAPSFFVRPIMATFTKPLLLKRPTTMCSAIKLFYVTICITHIFIIIFSAVVVEVVALDDKTNDITSRSRNIFSQAHVDSDDFDLHTLEASIIGDNNHNIRRELQTSSNCWSDPSTPPAPQWHPNYSAGWSKGYCSYRSDCNSPGYTTQLACCKGAYVGQTSNYCINGLPEPPTLSPTDVGMYRYFDFVHMNMM